MRPVVLPAKGWFGKEPGNVFGIELLWGLLSRQTTTGSGSSLRLGRVGDGKSIRVKVPPKCYFVFLIYRHCWRQKTELGGPRSAQICLFLCCYDFTQEHTFIFYFWRQKSKLLFFNSKCIYPRHDARLSYTAMKIQYWVLWSAKCSEKLWHCMHASLHRVPLWC